MKSEQTLWAIVEVVLPMSKTPKFVASYMHSWAKKCGRGGGWWLPVMLFETRMDARRFKNEKKWRATSLKVKKVRVTVETVDDGV